MLILVSLFGLIGWGLFAGSCFVIWYLQKEMMEALDRNISIANDNRENARRALEYVLKYQEAVKHLRSSFSAYNRTRQQLLASRSPR